MTLGVYFALTEEQLSKLLSLKTDDERFEHITEDIEETWDEENLQDTDKAWNAMHRCLTDHPPDTPNLDPDCGDYPLKLCVLGGEKVLPDDFGYCARLIRANEVSDLTEALNKIDKNWMSGKYWLHCKGAWPEFGEEDFEYMWDWFVKLREFYKKSAAAGRAVMFTVSG